MYLSLHRALSGERSRGFTLIEALVTALMSGLVLGSMGLLLSSGLAGSRANNSIADVTQTTEVATLLLLDEIRLAGYLGGDDASLELDGDDDNLRRNIEGVLQPLTPLDDGGLGRWPFTFGILDVPTIALQASGGPLLGAPCDASALGEGCVEIVSVSEITDNDPDDNDVYELMSVRYWLENTTPNRPPSLVRRVSRFDCSGPDASPAFSCTAVGGSTTEGEIALGVEDFQLYWFDGASWRDWSTAPIQGGLGRQVGIYLRGIALDADLSRNAPFVGIGIDLPDSVTINPRPSAFDGRFRRVEKWLDIPLFNLQS